MGIRMGWRAAGTGMYLQESSMFLQVVRCLWPGPVSLVLFYGGLEGRRSQVPSSRQPPSLWH